MFNVGETKHKHWTAVTVRPRFDLKTSDNFQMAVAVVRRERQSSGTVTGFREEHVAGSNPVQRGTRVLLHKASHCLRPHQPPAVTNKAVRRLQLTTVTFPCG
jgi:hypothetical protein